MKKVTLLFVVLLGLWAFLLIYFSVFRVATPDVVVERKQISPSAEKWMTETWISDEKSFVEARAFMNENIKTGDSLESVTRVYEAAAQQAKDNPQNALAQFSHGYAYIRATMVQKDIYKLAQLQNLIESMEAVTSPQTYEFSRLRFILKTQVFPDPQIKDNGRRLQAHVPSDLLVSYYYLECLDLRLAEDRKDAIAITNDLLQLHSDNVSTYEAVGAVYYRMWLVSKQDKDAKKSLDLYLVYKEKAKPKGVYKKELDELISRLEKAALTHK